MAREKDFDRAFETNETDCLAWSEGIHTKLGVTLGQILLAAVLVFCLLGFLGYLIYSVEGVPYFAKQHLQLEKGKEPHHWTYQEFDSLKLSSDEHETSGYLADKIAQRFGKAEIDTSVNDLTMTYSPSSKSYGGNPFTEVTLTFWRVKGKYYLSRKEAENIQDGKNFRLQEKPSVTDEAAYESLNVGNFDDGEGGDTYQSVVKQFGFPQSNHIDVINNGHTNLTIDYRWNEGNHYYDQELTFSKHKDGHYYLKSRR